MDVYGKPSRVVTLHPENGVLMNLVSSWKPKQKRRKRSRIDHPFQKRRPPQSIPQKEKKAVQGIIEERS